jgi:hypothetical protein
MSTDFSSFIASSLLGDRPLLTQDADHAGGSLHVAFSYRKGGAGRERTKRPMITVCPWAGTTGLSGQRSGNRQIYWSLQPAMPVILNFFDELRRMAPVTK